ncbi:MAG TPA: hypothetical protein VHO70_22250 [Chitinispirillaceae bacterium]|nr:hypothetical protein [Chitinispirillaceae bacterium]
MKKLIVSSILLTACTIGSTVANDDNVISKDVTIIHGTSTADGKSEIGERILEECITTLPSVNELDPVVSSSSQYLKEINGDPQKNDFVKTYSATLEISYIIYQKVLIVVTTNSVKGQEPVMKVMEKNLTQTKRFESNSSDGDLYAGRSHRAYYFSTPDGASADVKKRAAAWLKQQASVLCKK